LAFATKQVTAVWPPTGIAVAALLLLGYGIWPGILLGAFISNALSNEPLLTAAAIAIGNTCGPLLGAFLLRRFAFDTALERLRDVLAFVVLGAALPMTVTATNGVFNLAIAGIVPWAAFLSVWWVWWAGDAMGAMLVAPLILTWATTPRPIRWDSRRALELAILGGMLTATTWISFVSRFPLAYPVYPFVIWAALRFGQRATTLAIVTVSTIAIWGAKHDLGPFRNGTLDERLILLLTFMAILCITGLVLGAITAERRAAATQLRSAELRFSVLAESVPQIVWTADATGWIDWYNRRWYEYTGQTKEEAAGWGWQRAHHPEDFPRVMRDWARSIATGEPFEMEFRLRGADGIFRWFLTRVEPLRDAEGSIVRWYGTNTDVDDQKRALEETRRIAETLGAAFLPEKLPQRADLRFDALYLAAGQEALVGGDWYDAFELPDGQILISIGDVIGHGLSAAVNAGRIRQGIIASAFDASDPASILAKVNRMLGLQDDAVVTALVAVIDSALTTMRYASAGHPPPIIAGPTISARSLGYGTVPLGVAPQLEVRSESVGLERDAVILFYTDGVVEFKRDIESGERALREAVAALVGDTKTAHPALALQRRVMGSEKPTDDVVLLLLQLATAPSTAQPVDEAGLRKIWSFHSSDAYSAHATRHELMTFIRGFKTSEEELFRVELVLGEILANTVEHAPGLVNIELDWASTNPVLTIVDTGPGFSRFAAQLPEDALAENGRGLFLISTLAVDVKAASEDQRGTKMTVVLPIARTP
jgi:PAS domain S-box-containing protein